MRKLAEAQRDFTARAISGTHTILLALDCPESRCKGLLGFAFARGLAGEGDKGLKPLRSQKVFRSIVPDPKNAKDPNDPTKPRRFYTDQFPVQSFLWGDYAATPGTSYRLRVRPMYGTPGDLKTNPLDEINLEIQTEHEWDGTGHGVWFNRGAIASQKFSEEFGNKAPTNVNDPKDPEVRWLSRGLLDACLNYINETPLGDALRVAAYEFTYPPILNALKKRLDDGLDVQIVYHDTTDAAGQPNETAMRAAGLPVNDQKITFRRSKTKIPHNKFIVRLKGGKVPVEVWTGSTNFTPSGFLGQTNVGHRVADRDTARQYLDLWKLVKKDPTIGDARTATAALTPNPAEVIASNSVARMFSPRAKAEMLGWYGRRMMNAANSVWFTAAFGISPVLMEPIAKKRDQMRFVLMEKPAPAAAKAVLTEDISHVFLSYGVPLGELYRITNGKPTARMRIKEFELDKWFFKEEHYRPAHDGFVFFVHTKFLLIDPLSDDPLVCSGSANFSSGSLLQNDENMLFIRGNTRVADIYMTEFDRIFRHFYFRDVANELAAKGDHAVAIFLDEDHRWTTNYFTPGHQKTNRRLMFFAKPSATWFGNAADRPVKPAARKAAGSKAEKSPKRSAAKNRPQGRPPKRRPRRAVAPKSARKRVATKAIKKNPPKKK
jgi:phosphatidylserine/phosphatidylglycerophosphate/cardiolipin synthase-like enzyme